jgi:hypothetical protein
MDAGVVLYGLPPNSTHWSQPADMKQIFGQFKNIYYKLLDNYLLDRCDGDDDTDKGALGAEHVLPLIKKAMLTITGRQILAAFVACGLSPGQSARLVQERLEAQQVVISAAPDLNNSLNSTKLEKMEAKDTSFGESSFSMIRSFLQLKSITPEGKKSSRPKTTKAIKGPGIRTEGGLSGCAG